MSEQAYKNTDRELWRGEHEVSDYYADSVYVTEDGKIGFNVGGYCVAKPPREWLDLAWPCCPECETRALHPPWCSVGHRKAAADEVAPPQKAPCPGCGTHHSEYGKCPHDAYLEAEPCVHMPTREGDTLICDDCGVSLNDDGSEMTA